MLFVVVVLLVALAIGYALGGRLHQLTHTPLRYGVLAAAAFGVQAVAGFTRGSPYVLMVGLAALLVAGFLVLNRTVPGTGLVALGLALNALVVGLNGAMPVSADASGRAGISTQRLLDGSDPRHLLAGAGTRLGWLGDVVPVLLPYRPEVASPGDLMVLAGLAELIVVGMCRARLVAGCSEPTAKEQVMAKKGRKRRARKKSNANHGKRPNA